MSFNIRLLLPFFIPIIIMGQESLLFSAGRPSAGEPSTVVPKGFFQFESGWRKNESRSRNVLVRMGLTNRIELRFSLDDIITDHEPFYGGFMGGIMYQLTKEDRKRLESALYVTVSAPNRDDGVSFDGATYKFFAALSAFMGDIGLDFNLGGSSYSETFTVFYTAGVGYDLTDKISVFIEAYGHALTSGFPELVQSVDGGITYRPFHVFQIDINGGLGLTEKGEDTFVEVGLAFRLPH
ncbi:MAG: transporter [Candidatus Marinimicrobia bacterium]|nr:transporter [Candidatus Neomarinimicrobiota bacterium]